MTIRAVVVHPEAVAEGEAAAEWYTERNPSAAAGFRAELNRAIESIARAPQMWPVYISGTRRFPLRRFPFEVIYREAGDTIEVVAIAHGRRRPGYWEHRSVQ